MECCQTGTNRSSQRLVAAPHLAEGQKYFYEVETTNAPGIPGYVEIRNSRAVTSHGLGPCFQADGEKWIRVVCPN